MLTFNSCHLAWRSLELEVFGFLTIGSQRMAPKPIMESQCRTFPTFSCFSVCPRYWFCGTHETDLTLLWAQGQTPEVDMRQSSSTRKCRCVKPSPSVSSYASLSTRLSDPAHDATDQTYHHGRCALIRGVRRSELKIQLVVAETARRDGVELLQLVLSP